MKDTPEDSGEASPIEGWVRRLQAGDGSALEPLIAHSQERGWQIAYAILQNPQEVEDALQDAYLTVYQKIAQLQQPEAFWGWFKRILIHRCLRLRQRPITEALQEHEPEVAVSPGRDERLDIAVAFRSLSEADRTVLGLREVLDYSYEEIARVLEVPTTTIKTRLYNARQRLFKFFRKQDGGNRS